MKQKRTFNGDEIQIFQQRDGRFLVSLKWTGEILAYNLNKDLLIRKISKVLNIGFDMAKTYVDNQIIYPASCYQMPKQKKPLVFQEGINAIMTKIGEVEHSDEYFHIKKWKIVGNGRFSWFETATPSRTQFKFLQNYKVINEFIETLNEQFKKLGFNIKIVEDR